MRRVLLVIGVWCAASVAFAALWAAVMDRDHRRADEAETRARAQMRE
jgi:hypothetical protein